MVFGFADHQPTVIKSADAHWAPTPNALSFALKCKVLIKLFQKFAVSKGGALVALRRVRIFYYGVFFLLAQTRVAICGEFASLFHFAPITSKEKAAKVVMRLTKMYTLFGNSVFNLRFYA